MRSLLFASLVGIAACSSAPPLDPSTPDYAKGSQAQFDFQPLRARWERGDRVARLALEPELVKFVAAYNADPTARTASAMLAIIATAKGEHDHADALAAPLIHGPTGVTRDMALVARGAATRARGDASGALAILAPLFGKLLDPFARDLLNEEVSIAAVDAGDYANAVRFVRGWLNQTPEDDRAECARRIAALLERVPKEPLVDLVQSVKSTDELTSDLLKLVGKRLSDIAVKTGDVALAKFLIDNARPILGDDTDAVARVAARGEGIRLDTNTVGVLLSLRNDEVERRGLEVTNGLGVALGLPGSNARVVSRDDQGDLQKVDESLALLNADGAAVILAGLDTPEADVARAYAERTGVPVILLRPPSKPVQPNGPVFVIGDDPREVRDDLGKALAASGATRVAIVAGTRDETAYDDVAGLEIVGVSACGAKLDFLSTQRAGALIVDGSPTCARETLASTPGGLSIALGFDAPPEARAKLRVSAGRYPITSSAVDDADLVAYYQLGRGAPSWWAGLGHDAGKLAWSAVSQLPATKPEDARAIAARKLLATNLVEAASADLWTTNERSFSNMRVLPREITIVGR